MSPTTYVWYEHKTALIVIESAVQTNHIWWAVLKIVKTLILSSQLLKFPLLLRLWRTSFLDTLALSALFFPTISSKGRHQLPLSDYWNLICITHGGAGDLHFIWIAVIDRNAPGIKRARARLHTNLAKVLDAFACKRLRYLHTLRSASEYSIKNLVLYK